MFLEKQMQNVDGILSGFEEQLAKDGTILDQPNALMSRNQQLQVLYFITQPKKVKYLTILRLIWADRARDAKKIPIL